MKFVCESCKAKYQIADDKVAGKSLRMKCRKCGHMIHVAASVTESSVSQQFPVPTPGPAVPSPMMADEPTSDDGGATVVRASPMHLLEQARATAAAGRPAAPAHPAAAQGRAPAPARPAVGAPPPRPGAPAARPAPPPAPRPSSADLSSHSPSSPALAAGFQRAVVSPSAAPAAPPLPTEDWYVGVGGVPLGPVRLASLRDKAAAGQVDAESLVWREGFDEWQPVRAFPALLALVEEARQVRASRTNLPAVSLPGAPPARSSIPVGVIPDAAPSLPFDLQRPSAAPAPAPAPAPPRPAESVPSVAALAALAAPAPAPFAPPPPAPSPFAPPQAGSSPFAPTAPAAALSPAAPAVSAGLFDAPVAPVAPLAPPPAPSPDVAGTAQTSTTSVLPPPESRERKKGGMHPAALAFIAMAAVFGGVAAWAVFLRTPPQPVATAPGGAAATAKPTEGGLGAPPPPPPPPSTGAAGGPTATSSPGTPSNAGGLQSGTGSSGRPVASSGSTGTASTAAPIDTSGFGSGPKGPATDPDPGGGGGQGLTEGELNGVVSRNRPIITRRCWTPAYDARATNAPKTARVNASVTVGPSGSVQSVSASGASEHYPSLASCVSSSIRGWQFPTASGSTTVNIPFVFSGQ